ncbi:mediator of RNA polymerase II transcription subunit 21-like [Styela clava]|uniref:mediator of RNA polymerase II transcription subunit 21-like n=1 Tax=Styela clava TaxID=7725 RepID=UPI00193A7261|nr:mediator of RNA polymerase II transcription subunit 21-like [Styela clava]
MSDRLTQLQDAVNQMAEYFCNSVGILQQNAPPGSFAGLEKTGNKEPAISTDENVKLFATLITRTAKDINVLVDSLPSEESTPELQAAHLTRLEQENQAAAANLENLVQRGELELNRIQTALAEIAEAQLAARKLEAILVCESEPAVSFPVTDNSIADFSDIPQR